MRKMIMVGLIFATTFYGSEIKENSIQDTFVNIKKSIYKLIKSEEKQDTQIIELKNKIKELENIIKNENIKIPLLKPSDKEIIELLHDNKKIYDNKFLINTWNLNIRKEPSKTSGIIKSKKMGAVLIIKGDANDEWFELTEGGYVKKERLVKAIEQKIETTKRVNLRNAPNTEKESLLEVVEKGTKFNSIGSTRDWYVLDNGNFIYINNAARVVD